MKKSALICAPFIILFSSLALPGFSAADNVLYVPEREQEHSQWCWAGSSQAVLEHYGTRVEQCVIANYAWGRTDCCGNTDFNWSNADCNKPNFMYPSYGSLSDILAHWGVNSTGHNYTLDWSTSLSEINAYRPIVMRFGWKKVDCSTYTGGGHFLVVYGYDQTSDNYLDYMDPWPGHGYTKSLHSWVVSSCDHNWTHTLQISTNPVSTCPINPVMIGSTNYPSINEAYISATNEQTINIKAQKFTETLNLTGGNNVTLHGGYNCDYSSQTGFTTIAALTIRGSTVTVENIIIK